MGVMSRETAGALIEAAFAAADEHGAVSFASVSYTHLTLPTICSV